MKSSASSSTSSALENIPTHLWLACPPVVQWLSIDQILVLKKKWMALAFHGKLSEDPT